MSSTSSFTYAEDHAAGHHARHRGTHRTYQPALGWWQPATPNLLQWDDIANWKSKTVWGVFDGKRQQLLITGLAPEGNEGEHWYAMPQSTAKFQVFSVLKAKLELAEKPVTCTALTIVPQIKKRLAGRSLNLPEVIYL
jgi:hypothetical protein